ncbi:Rv3235 family protein [Streptomyces filamentosus]|uniref:Rv3235 family protein n=1 Tax=Streptomyces filamentosus TaxID=67294 RepID=UPI0037CD2066
MPHATPAAPARTTTARAAAAPATTVPAPRTSPGARLGRLAGRPGAAGAPAAGAHPVRRPGTASRRALPVHTAFAERLLAVLSGDRPVHSMLGLTVGEAYEQLVLLAPRTAARGPGPRPVLRRCAAQPHAGDTVLEVFASLAAGPRIRALAFRLELGPDHRWRCAAVELDGLGRLTDGESGTGGAGGTGGTGGAVRA